MKCLKCGHESKGNKCPNCGSTYNFIKTKTLKENKRKENLILGTVVVIFLVLLSVGFINLNIYAKKEYFEIEGIKVPTITSVIGETSVVNYMARENTRSISYNSENIKSQEIQDYIYLLNKNKFIMYEKKIGLGLVKQEKDKIIEVNMIIENGSLVIDYVTKKDNIKNYNLIGDIKIGNEKVGYLKIPAYYEKQIDPYKIVYGDDIEHVSMELIKDQSIISYTKKLLENYKEKSASTSEFLISIHGYDGYQINATFNNQLYVRNYIIEKDGEIINISFETNNSVSDINAIIYSYEVVK